VVAVTPVSLVVPVRDEAESIGRLLSTIEEQVRRPDEILIVDGGSTDGTLDLARRLTADDDRYRIVEAGPATPGRGRNVGIDAAAHAWVALTDAGIELDRFWLARLVRVVEHDPSVDVVYGSFSPDRSTPFARCAELAYVSPLRSSPVGPVRARSVASCLLRKDAWRRVGGFPDLRAAEDLVFMREVDALGLRVAVAPEARVTWQLQPSVRTTFEKFRSYSMHNVMAGQQQHWHHGLARQYLAGVALIALARVARRSPTPVLAAAAFARVGRTLWRRREGRGILWVVRPDRFLAVGVIMAVVDAATFAGWLDAHRRARRG
jgi:glycosyltransferase involved in cell wall biosynthesis